MFRSWRQYARKSAFKKENLCYILLDAYLSNITTDDFGFHIYSQKHQVLYAASLKFLQKRLHRDVCAVSKTDRHLCSALGSAHTEHIIDNRTTHAFGLHVHVKLKLKNTLETE